MSERSGSPDEGSGDEIRPHGEHDSSEESEDDPEEARRIAEGFIVDGEDDDEDDADADGGAGRAERRKETKEERRRRRKEEKRNRKRQRKERGAELSDDELELINENRGIAGPSTSRPLKRLRRRSGSGADDEDEEGSGSGRRGLRDMFADDEERLDEDDDDLGDFIEEDEEAAPPGETEDERRQRKREEKAQRRAQAKSRPDVAGVDKGSWDEIYDVFGDGEDYDWALQGEEGVQDEETETAKKDLRLEDVFDPSEIKARRLQDEDKAIASYDRPERHQLMNSTLSDNPVLAPDTLYPPPNLAALYAYNKVSLRTQYLFCGMHEEGAWPPLYEQQQYQYAPPRRPDLAGAFLTAVSAAINMLFVQHFEVPYVWHYKREKLSLLENEGRTSVQFLERDELWTLYTLGIKYRAVYERTQQVRDIWRKIQSRKPDVQNDYLEQNLLGSVCTLGIESASEGVDWLAYHYAQDIREIKEEEALADRTKRLPERQALDDLRIGPIMKLVDAFGVNVSTVAVAFNDVEGVTHAPKDSERAPLDLAGEFAGTGTPFLTADDALQAASALIINEMAKDPSIRHQAREFMKVCADVTVTPTDRGMTVIDDYHMYSVFKFLTSKPATNFSDTPQWLHILKAEEDGLLTIKIDVDKQQFDGFCGSLEKCCTSTDYGEVATKWNELRREICRESLKTHLIPMASKWLKEYLRSQAEDYVAERCRMELEFRVNVKPYCSAKGMEPGDYPSVLSVTNGKGDIRDAIIAILLDEDGSVRTQTKFDNLRDEADREAFIELIERRKPKVVAVGGLSIQTARLRDDVQSVLRDIAIRTSGTNPPISDTFPSHEDFTAALQQFDDHIRPFSTPLIMPSDATARMYMNSDEAEKEHPGLPLNARYALALARYVQNPLNAYAKLGRRMLDITFMEYHQKLISQEKLLIHLERALVNSVSAMGIEINSCVADPYQRSMLPFISGLGPRKADSVVHAVGRAGALLNRLQFSESGLFGPTVIENVAGFLSISSDLDNMILENAPALGQPDPLDCTRIHPEDYDFAQKMCQDALDLDVEDLEGQHKSEVVLKLMVDPDRANRLNALNLDDFAFNLQRQGEGNKRHALGEIINELISYRSDRRPPFYEPTPWEVVTMLTGETERTIGRGLRVSATVRKALPSRAFCQLESGIDAVLEREFVSDNEIVSCEDAVQPRQSLNAVVINVEPARFQVRISTRASELAQSVPFVQPFNNDPFNDLIRRGEAEDKAAQSKRRQQGKVKRVVNHPNWHVMNSGQAQQFLASQPRGEVVIRPSSKGSDHLALTFKLDEEVFQHVDIQEIDKPNEYALGRILRIGGKYSFGDLDDVIVNYVKAIMRMLEEAERSEKFRKEEDLDAYLKNTLLAFPNRSMYGFCLDRLRPGYLSLRFLSKPTKDGGVIQDWAVRLLPGAYALNNAEVPGINELCNAFKAQYSSRLSEQGMGGKTPGIRAGRTPAPGGRTPGGRTPALGGATPYGAGMGRAPAVGSATPYGAGAGPSMGRTPLRPGMTPNPYGAGGQPRPPMATYGGATPSQAGYANGGYNGQSGYPPQQGYGGPSGGAGAMRPPSALGMNPERAAMLARQGGQ